MDFLVISLLYGLDTVKWPSHGIDVCVCVSVCLPSPLWIPWTFRCFLPSFDLCFRCLLPALDLNELFSNLGSLGIHLGSTLDLQVPLAKHWNFKYLLQTMDLGLPKTILTAAPPKKKPYWKHTIT